MSRLSTLVVRVLRFRSEVARAIDRSFEAIGRRRQFYSSKGQDRWAVQRIFGGARGGYFVEIGAGDGRTHSNTFVLERDYAWSGAVVEANPNYTAAIRRNRRCACVDVCVDSSGGDNDFFCFGHLGGIVAEDTDNSWSRRGSLLGKHMGNLIRVRSMPLGQVLDLVGAPSKIDYLSIDVEGAEHRVLKGFPFDRFSFEAMTIERPTRQVHSLLRDAGYVLDRVYRHDGFYVSQRRAAMLGIAGLQFAGMPIKPF